MKNEPRNTSLRGEIGHAFETTIDILKDIFTLFFLELRLVKKNVMTLLIFLLFITLFFITSWLCLTWLLIHWLIGLQFSTATALFISLIINSSLGAGLLIISLFYKKKISFSATKQQIENLLENRHD